MKDLKKNVLETQTSTLKDVMLRLNEGVYGVVFLISPSGTVDGLMTDGDVRRALLDGAELNESVALHINKNFTAGREQNSHAQNLSLLSEKIRHIPILDDAGRLVDFLSWAEMLRIPVMEPSLGGNELKYVSHCVTSGWISSQGKYVAEFETMFSNSMTDKVESLAVSNGTAALHLALKALGIGAGDEVIVPDLTFAATANVVLHCGATPVSCDVDPETWLIDAGQIAAKVTDKTKAIIPVHLYGHPCDMDPIMDIANHHNIHVIEDCAEAQGATYKGKSVGTIGDIGCFSFFSNKVITTGEGGMVCSSDPTLMNKVKVLRDHGMAEGRRYWHDVPGFNFRMTNLQAAVGVAQMERLDWFITRRREIANVYRRNLTNVAGVTLPPNKDWGETVYWIYSILVDEDITGVSRDSLIALLSERNIETRPFFYPLHTMPPYLQNGSFDVTKRLSLQGISLPSGNDISDQDIERVCVAIKSIIQEKGNQ